ncbi:MAG: Verru_Chthon cassette protein D [Verrucomicrobiota bacterium]
MAFGLSPRSLRFPPLPLDGPRRAFSLIELIVVIGIISLLMVLSTLSIQSILNATQLDGTAKRVAEAIESARDRAMTLNRNVEVRFYQVPGPDGTPGYREIRLVGAPGMDEALLSPPIILPDRVKLYERNAHSSLLFDPVRTVTPTAPSDEASARVFQIRPDGGTDLPTLSDGGSWSLTFVRFVDAGDELPANHVRLEINPVTGEVFLTKPGG